MSSTNYMTVLDPGDMHPLSCSDCESDSFHLRQEVRDGIVEAFHTVCVSCGKRGILRATVETKVVRTFVEFGEGL